MVNDQNVIMKINIHKKDGSFDKQINVPMTNVHLSDFTIRKIRAKNTPEPKLILKKVGCLPETFLEEYKTNYFIINTPS